MERWWYSDNGSNGKDRIPKSKKSPSKRSDGLKKWKFSVLVNIELNLYEKIAVTGSCDELGNWDPDLCILLNKEEHGEYSQSQLSCNHFFFFTTKKTLFFSL
jgi:hypothetical protein